MKRRNSLLCDCIWKPSPQRLIIRPPRPDDFGLLCAVMAAARKWIEFTDTRAAMVVACDGFARWGRASTAAYKTGVFIRSGMEIPELSIAGMGSAGAHARADHPVALPPGVWTFSRGTEAVRELTFFSDRLGISISLLQFDTPTSLERPDEDSGEMDTYDKFITNVQS